VTDSAYIDYLIELCAAQRIGMIVPTIDTELVVLAKDRRSFVDAGVQAVISDLSLIKACRDKRLTSELFVELDIGTPKIYDKQTLLFPCFCKPYDGSRSIGAKIIQNPDMLTNELLEDKKNIFMELIGGEYIEYTMDAYFTQNSILRCLVPRERIEVRSGEVSKGITRKNRVYYYFIEKLQKLEGAKGCLTVQAFFNPITEDIKAIEINPRFGGGYPLTHAAGADYPGWLIREYFLGNSIEFSEAWENNLMMLRYDAKVMVRENDRF
ncbi:MAG: ATP-grasp domain-containing protein, partial [Gammaproteobacteria bacterium]